jgi:hypothetical protein
MAAVLIDGTQRRAAIGDVGGPPIVLTGSDVVPGSVDAALSDSGLDAVGRHMQAVALGRALDRATA